jgi:putative membrane protein
MYLYIVTELMDRGRKDFTSLISNARNLSRVRYSHSDHKLMYQLIWIATCLPSPDQKTNGAPPMTRSRLTAEKKKLIRMVVAFVIATKHHLRAEGGVHHEDLRGTFNFLSSSRS